MKNAILPRVLASVVHHLSKPSSFYHENNKENQKSFVEAYPDHFVLLHSPLMEGTMLQDLAIKLGDIHAVGLNVTGISKKEKRDQQMYENTKPESLKKTIGEVLDERNVTTQVSPQQFADGMELLRTDVQSLQTQLQAQRGAYHTPQTVALPGGTADDSNISFQHSDHQNYVVPDDFAFPPVHVLAGWRYWWTGYNFKRTNGIHTRISPFRDIRSSDIPQTNKILRNARKRCSEWRRVFMYVEDKVTALDPNFQEKPYSWEVLRLVVKVVNDMQKKYNEVRNATGRTNRTVSHNNKVTSIKKWIVQIEKAEN